MPTLTPRFWFEPADTDRSKTTTKRLDLLSQSSE